MSQATVGKWGKSLAVRLPREIADAVGIVHGEIVDLETRDGDVVIHPSESKRNARADALAAIEEILAARKGYSLGGMRIRELIDDDRP